MTSDISSGIFYKVVETNYQVVSRYNPYLGVCTLHHRRMLRVVPQKYFVTWLIRASSSNVAYKEVRKQLLHELTEKTLFIPRPKKGYVALGAVNWNIIFLFLSSENEKLNQAKFKNFTEVLETLSNDVPDTSVPATDDVLTQRVPSPARPAPEFAKETVENEESKLEKIEDATHPKVWAHIDSVSSSHTENPTRYMVLDSTAHPVYQMKGFVVEKQSNLITLVRIDICLQAIIHFQWLLAMEKLIFYHRTVIHPCQLEITLAQWKLRCGVNVWTNRKKSNSNRLSS